MGDIASGSCKQDLRDFIHRVGKQINGRENYGYCVTYCFCNLWKNNEGLCSANRCKVLAVKSPERGGGGQEGRQELSAFIIGYQGIISGIMK